MAGISFDGISNLSPEFQKAFQLSAQAERKGIEKVEERKGKVQEKVNLLNDVLGKVDNVKKLIPNLNSPIAIRDLMVTVDDPRVATGTVDKNIAVPGKYSLEILKLARSASALSNGFEDKDQTTIGIGYLTFHASNGETKEIFIDDENATLEGVAKIINSARIGMKATVINDQSEPDAPYRLLISAMNTGADANVEYPDFYLVDGEEELFMEIERPAENALLRYEGFEFESPSNEIKDLINGVNLSIKGLTDPGKPTTIAIEQDVPKTTVKMKELVDNMNHVFSFIQNQNTLDKESQSLKALGGDYAIRMAEDRLRSALQENLFGEGASVKVLSDLGIEFTRNGTLKFDEKKFQGVLTNDYEGVSSFLVGDGVNRGLIPKISRALSSINGTGSGVLASQRDSYNQQITRYNKEIEQKEKVAEQRMASLKERLAKAQSAVSQMRGQSNYFQSVMGGGGGGGLEQLLG